VGVLNRTAIEVVILTRRDLPRAEERFVEGLRPVGLHAMNKRGGPCAGAVPKSAGAPDDKVRSQISWALLGTIHTRSIWMTRTRTNSLGYP